MISHERAIKNARLSVEIEGFKIDNEIENLCRNILEGKYSLQEYIDKYFQEKTKRGENINVI